MSNRKKHEQQVQQTVEMVKRVDPPPPEEKKPASNTTVLKLQISEDGAGNISVEWVTLMKDTGVAVPMRPAHIIGTIEAAKHILCKQYYETHPQAIPPAASS